MNSDDRLYGLEGWEMLEPDLDSAVRRALDDACEWVSEGFDVIADRITWPLQIVVYKRMDIGGDAEAQQIADRALDRALDDLDADYGNEDGDEAEPTPGMQAAALAFGRAVVAEYVPWTCESTGEVVEVTRAMAAEREVM